ncbi:ribonuclease [Spirosoma sp. RP8]|uniref:Ribonuclease n=2 Tax=Spirosoma TaxID=107 RepID=A0ABT0HK70_9BACT|nr:ribonuclease domain-containing protein [Spirosoma liriopis]MCK8491990.1 ribonuclease [Spirosoma liriopis]
MIQSFFRTLWYFSLFVLLIPASVGCRSDQQDNNRQNTYQQEQSYPQKHQRHKHQRQRARTDENNQYSTSSEANVQAGEIPAKVLKVLDYVRRYGRAPDGYVGGRTFGNYEGHLPKQDNSGDRVRYREWDVNPKIQGRNRGTERLITGSDERSYFTQDHYNSFTEIK